MIRPFLIFPFTSNFSSGYLRWQPGRDYSRLYQHDQLSDSGRRNKTNLTANLSVAIILWISLFSATRFCNFLVYQLIRSVSRGHPGGDDSDVDDQRQAWRGKQNKQEKSETAVRESIGVVHWRCR